jgi:hypothetical protein
MPKLSTATVEKLFAELEPGDFFFWKGGRYRKILHAKSWCHQTKNIIYYNAVGTNQRSKAWLIFDSNDLVRVKS